MFTKIFNKNDFVEAINAYKKNLERLDKIDNLLDNICDGFPVVEEGPAASYLLNLIIKLTDDKDEMISWWLFEDVDKVVDIEGCGKFILNTPEDLYDYLDIICHPEDDCADPIADLILKAKCDYSSGKSELDKIPSEKMEVYQFICSNTDDTIKILESLNSNDYSIQNILVCLKVLKKEIKKEN